MTPLRVSPPRRGIALVADAAWFIATLPFRVFFWFVWQARRIGLLFVITLQRRFGQRNALFIIAACFGAFGLALLTGLVRCQPGGDACQPGREPGVGIIGVAMAVLMTLLALRRSNDRTPTVSLENDPLRYDHDELPRSWRSVLTLASFVLFVTVGVAVVVWLRSL